MSLEDLAVSRARPLWMVITLTVTITAALPWRCATADWQRVRTDNGVTVYRQDEPDTNLDAIRGVTTLTASLGALVAVLNDPATFPQWHPDFKEARLVEQTSFRERYIYLVNDMPWPAKDRDVCYRVSLSHDPQTKVVTFELDAAPHEVPTSRHVRVLRSRGAIQLEPLGDRRVRVSWTLFTDPRLSAPASMINDSVVEGRIKLLANLRRRVAEAPYRNARLTYDRAGHLDGIHYPGDSARGTRLDTGPAGVQHAS